MYSIRKLQPWYESKGNTWRQGIAAGTAFIDFLLSHGAPKEVKLYEARKLLRVANAARKLLQQGLLWSLDLEHPLMKTSWASSAVACFRLLLVGSLGRLLVVGGEQPLLVGYNPLLDLIKTMRVACSI